MSNEIPMLRIDGVVERGVANGGDIGILGIVGPGGEHVRLGMEHHVVDVLALQATELIAQINEARRQSGKDKGPIISQARKIEGVGAILDRQRGDLMLQFVLEGGIKTTFGLNLESVENLMAVLRDGKEAMLKFTPPPAS